jgi:hypothetical protein
VGNLTDAEFKATFAGASMKPVGAEEDPSFDFWPYFALISRADFEGHDFSGGRVKHVYRSLNGRFTHVLVSSEQANVFMVLVLDEDHRAVVGHRLVDLNKEYGLET